MINSHHSDVTLTTTREDPKFAEVELASRTSTLSPQVKKDPKSLSLQGGDLKQPAIKEHDQKLKKKEATLQITGNQKFPST